ncbi:pilus assembly PilX N-terminal domain-containing protein [Pontiella agarivorans]|uniref:Pilus assembly PilX N-terminal domain-containing protein n=1 Tax=Pontiella agarivorans TaxID=3038953 RepID=A0ABU5N1K2_9BACT|nr:pilus assembly PilX N-terminal domain-containing protein [Pontiella agarivorans]MDZ8120307.1 pilus assembly PilX N-terminal domain-containing protein [Pontiella agarivorans]
MMKPQLMTTKNTNRNGSVLLTILIIMFVLTIAMGSLLTLSTQYFFSTQTKVDAAQALYYAEAGVEEACQFVSERGVNIPDSYSGTGTNGVGSFDWDLEKTNFYSGNIVSVGEFNGQRKAIEIRNARSATYAQFAFWAENNLSIYFKNGETFWGHIHTDSKPWFSGDPEFNDVFTTLANSYGGSTNSVDFKSGFKMNTAMGSMAEIDFDDMKYFAQTYPDNALLLTGATSFKFDGNQVLITNEAYGWDEEPYTLDSEKLIYIQDGTIDTTESYYQYVGKKKGDYNYSRRYGYYYAGYNKGYYDLSTRTVTQNSPGSLSLDGGDLDGRLTIVTEDDIYINDHTEYALDPLDNDAVNDAIAYAKDNNLPSEYTDVVNDALGLISGDDVIITGYAPDNIHIDATIMATGSKSPSNDPGSFYVENYTSYDPRGFINLLGGIVQEERGPVGSFSTYTGKTSHSFDKNYVFDWRFAYMPPPFYPPLYSKLTFDSWQEISPES